MSTIAENIQTLQSIKADIKSAIIEKGGVATDYFGGYAQAIMDLPSGGGGRDEELEAQLLAGTLSEYSNSKATEIKNHCFVYDSNIKSVNLPQVNYVGSYAFTLCSNLSYVNIPNLERTSFYAFQSCGITTINLPKLTGVNIGVFQACKKLTSINLPLVSFVSNSGMEYCSSLQTIELPQVKTLGVAAFNACFILTTASFPQLSSMSGSALRYCSNLTTVYAPKLQYIGEYAFDMDSKLNALTTSDNVTIDNWAFPSVTQMPFVEFPSKAILLGSRCFPSSIMSMFSEANLIYSSVLPTSWKTASEISGDYYGITGAAVAGNKSLITVDLPNAHRLIYQSNYPQYGTFASCYNLTNVNIPNLEIAEQAAFRYCSSMTSFNFPNLRIASDFAFAQCIKLETAILPNLESVPYEGFCSCHKLNNVEIPMVSTLGQSAFRECSALETINLPNVTYISLNAFSRCTNLKVVNINNVTAVTKLESSAFYYANNAKVYVPSSLVDAFKADSMWRSMSSRIFPYEG